MVPLGHGQAVYEAGRAFLMHWGPFQLPWARVDPQTPGRPGTGVALTAGMGVVGGEARGVGFWSVLPLRVLYSDERVDTIRIKSTISSTAPHTGAEKNTRAGPPHTPPPVPSLSVRQSLFQRGVGCLHGHWFRGEERFSVVWERPVGARETEGPVTLEVLSFSRPDGWLPTLIYPILRLQQLRFGWVTARRSRRSMT